MNKKKALSMRIGEWGKRIMRKNEYRKQMAMWALLGVLGGGISGCVPMIEEDYPPAYEEMETETPQEELLWEELPQEESSQETSGQEPVFAFTETGGGEVAEIVERAMPAVVSIRCVSQYEGSGLWGHSRTYEGISDGSGIIIGQNDRELLIVTNQHVVEGAVDLLVTFVDDETAKAHVKGAHKEMDLAVVAVEMEEIPRETKAKIAIGSRGDSDFLRAGEGIIAIGNAMGYGQAVTVGYVSAVNREVQTDDQTVRSLIQIDAAINPGNSGGALLNMQGEIVGINSAKIALAEVEGMGYAIPITKAWDIIVDLAMQETRALVAQDRQGYLGIQGKDVSAQMAALKKSPQGIRIRRISQDGAAAYAGLKKNDIITAFDGQAVTSVDELSGLLCYYQAGEDVEITVFSPEGSGYREHQVSVVLGSRPEGRRRNGEF